MLRILKTQQQNEQARSALRRKGLDLRSTSILQKFMRKAGLLTTVEVGDAVKSWDVLNTVQLIDQELPRESAILDLGAYSSEVLGILHRLGYQRLAGIDMNPDIRRMPYHTAIQYIEGNFLQSPFPDRSLNAVTAISVIEHGFQADRLLRELSRIVVPGGYFIASVDYWPEKIDTTGLQAFGLDWMIFSEQDMREFIALADTYGFSPAGDLDFGAGDAVAHWNDRDYTFAWLVLRRVP